MNDLGNKDTMAENIQYYMDLNGKTRKEVCEALSLSYTTFTDWIKGRKYPRIDKIEIMANYFGITKADLVEKRPTESRKLFIKNLHSYLKSAGKTTDDLIRDLGFNRGEITEWEAGSLPKMKDVEKLADYFGIRKEYFLTDENAGDMRIKQIASAVSKNERLLSLFDMVKDFSDKDLDFLLEMASRIKPV